MAVYKKPASLETAIQMDKSCQGHFSVMRATENPVYGNSQIDALELVISCLAATDESQIKRQATLLVFFPKETDWDQGAKSQLIHARLADALGMLPQGLAADDEYEIDWTKSIGRQFKAFIKHEMNKKRERMETKFDEANIFHVDDLEAKHIPASDKHLAILPPALRRIQKGTTAPPANKAPATGAKTNGANAGTGKPAPTTPPAGNGATATAGAEVFNADDL